MEMSLDEYLAHYFEPKAFIIFLLLAFVILSFCYFIFYLFAKSHGGRRADDQVYEFVSLSERFHEIIFSGTSIILFIAVYYMINRFVTGGEFREFWDRYKDFLLLLLIIISILFNTLWDSLLVRLTTITPEEKASGRLVGMIYMILIFCYIKFIYENDNYDMFIAYFLTLMIGRFVYFDASFKDFVENCRNAIANLPLMFMGLCYTGLMCLYGFSTGYLIKHNGVITNVFFTHLYMCVAIFALNKIVRSIVIDSIMTKRNKRHSRNDDNTLTN